MDLMALKAASPYTFQSQYMQDPGIFDGGIFSENDFLYYGHTEDADLPTPCGYEYRFITVDTAQKLTSGTTGLFCRMGDI